MKQGLVSAVIPTVSKRSEYLNRAIHSVVNQSYHNIETVVVNDASIPPTTARNVGIDRSNGEFISPMDDDDTWHKNKTELQTIFLNQHPDIPMVICWSKDLRVGNGRINKPKKVVSYKELLKGFQLSSTSSYMIRKSILDKIKDQYGYVFDTSLPTGHEYDLALRIAKDYGDIHCLQQVLITQYKSNSQISFNWSKKIRGQYAFMNKWGNEYRLLDYLKRIGLIGMFFGGFFLRDRIMYPINMLKTRFEEKEI